MDHFELFTRFNSTHQGSKPIYESIKEYFKAHRGNVKDEWLVGTSDNENLEIEDMLRKWDCSSAQEAIDTIKIVIYSSNGEIKMDENSVDGSIAYIFRTKI